MVTRMFVFREALEGDAAQVLAVAKFLDSVNLPAKPDYIAEILSRSRQSFAAEIPVAEREYVFVLEDLEAKKIIGTSMIHAQHGRRGAPHVYFEVLRDERYSESLDRYLVHDCLRLAFNYDGPTEIGGLILLPEYRRHPLRLGRFLSFSRFLFIASHRSLFREHVLSELLPPLRDDGTSILWDHVGFRFTNMSYQEADLESKHNKKFIRALFPLSLIYAALLPDEVQAVIGQVGSKTKGVERMLRKIGFHYANQIDPFDGGPHFVAPTDSITLVKATREVEAGVLVGEQRDKGTASTHGAIVAAVHADAPRFRAVLSSGVGDTATLPPESLACLGVEAGTAVWTTELQ